MWNRQDLKRAGKAAFLRNYWYCVVVSFILNILARASSSSNNGSGIHYKFDIHNINPFAKGLVLGSFLISIAIAIAIEMFIKNPLRVGCASFYIKNADGKCDLSHLVDVYKDGKFINIFISSFMAGLITFLWSLLLIIPGIMKAYSYKMVPYIIAENPDIYWRDALQLSQEMMYGNRMDAFILDLSFIGWHILSSITWGMFGYFFVNPYVDATHAELYLTLKERHVYTYVG